MREREINNVKFFLNFLNQETDLDFVIDNSFDDEQSHVDVILYSKKLDKKVYIQNVAYRDGTFYKYGQSNVPKFRPVFVLGKTMTDKERKKSILKCIKEKEQKYQSSLVNNIVLIIEVTIPAIKPEQIKKYFPSGISTNFKGVYFVQLPVTMAAIDDKYGQTGYVYTLKSLAFK
jgi:hypothetical protein